MMRKKSTYKAAHEVSKSIEQHFAMHLEEAQKRGEPILVHAPKSEIVEMILDVAFWASLLKEEGHSPKLSLVFLSPEQVESPLIFAERLSFSSHVLAKLSPGFEQPGVHLGVWQEKDELYIWGATNKIPAYSFVLNVPEPGLLVIKHRRRDEYGKFTNVAVLNGDEIKVVDEKSAQLPDCPSLLTSLLGFRVPVPNESANVLIQLAVAMRGHGRGGSLLIVPTGTEQWRHSIRQPMHYAIQPAFSALAELVRHEKNGQELWPTALKREVDEVAGLTAIDGAVIMNDRYEVLAFGAKIIRSGDAGLVEQMIVTEPVVGYKGLVVPPSQNNGTRHLSAAQFVHDQKDALALVASQDGRFTVFTWSPCERMVQAHRIEVLLL